MSGTMQALSWAFGLKDAEPDEKLLAIYLATLAGQSMVVSIDPVAAAIWCGFVSPAKRIPRPARVRGALQSIPGISWDYRADGKIAVMLGGVA